MERRESLSMQYAEDEGYKIALQEARDGLAEGGMAIGACIVSREGKVIGRGRNMKMQNGSPILHAETAAFDSDRSLPQGAFEGATLYTTMSPCPMCTGTAIWLGVKRVVVGDNLNYYGPQELLHNAGIEVIVLNTDDCVRLGKDLVSGDPKKWQMVR